MEATDSVRAMRKEDLKIKCTRFDAFICYKRNSGEDFAEHLKKGLEELGVHAFLDIRDIPEKFRGTQEWIDTRDRAVTESKTFLLIITPGFDKSPEIRKELSLARKYEDKEFLYFRHKDLTPNLRIMLDDEELDMAKQQQVPFDTKHELLRKAHSILIEGQKAATTLDGRIENSTGRKLQDTISNFAAFYDTVYGARKVQKVYPRLFTAEEMNSPGKADKICRVLETYVGNKAQFRQALQTIINLHRDYSLSRIGALRDIIVDLGFTIGDDLSLSNVRKIRTHQSTREIVRKYHEAVMNNNTNEPLPFKACPECGSKKLERGTMMIQGEPFFTIKCTECGWSGGTK